MADKVTREDADAIYVTASGLVQQTVNSRGYVQMSPGLAITIAAQLRGLSRSADAAKAMADAERDPGAAVKAAGEAIRRYVDKVRAATVADQEAEAALLARTVAATKK